MDDRDYYYYYHNCKSLLNQLNELRYVHRICSMKINHYKKFKKLENNNEPTRFSEKSLNKIYKFYFEEIVNRL
ncbi:hypothetical protein AYR72_gp015 [Cnaphalocrocis medinalis granulovirus]|uniref:ORF19 n=1 Tax=Cnaphalocrocis medinalis granulovirus TaxID=1750712 RepID=A0A109WZ91_9BBAC|nr:hypothetical protein AYR72_gp015 [Cnaphalocrocis medinalis granulovirus]ALN41952.1 ORF19 [Cnaphalocrocis medinalis granulovirus]AMF83766.1 hypothetical protein [Cnaphalocrocis medinalis granulovirus]